MYKRIISLSVFALFFSITGCQDILECVINRKPILSDNALSAAFVNQNYSELVTAEIQNEPRDNAYYYDYFLTGDLPPGIDVFFDFRDVIIEGIPLERGRYRFTIHLNVGQIDSYCENDLNDCDGLCEDRTARTFILTVN